MSVPLVLALGLATGTGQVLAGAFGGALGWALLRWVVVTRFVASDFHRGRRAVADEQWAEGRTAFSAAIRRWRSRPGLDRWRAPLLGTTSRWPYLLMSRYNHAVCLACLGEDDAALAEIDAIVRDAPRLREARRLQDALRTRLGRTGGPPRAVGEGEWFGA